MKKLLLRLVIIALPVAAFWWLLQAVVIPLFETGAAVDALGYVLGGVVFLAVWEGTAFRAWVLPLFGRALQESVYGGSYSTADDPLVSMAARIRKTSDSTLLADFLVQVEREASRARAWTELAALYTDTFHNLPDALHALLQGTERVDSVEDRAMLLYRAAKLRYTGMGDRAGAAELAQKAATLYPATVYGKKAAQFFAQSHPQS